MRRDRLVVSGGDGRIILKINRFAKLSAVLKLLTIGPDVGYLLWGLHNNKEFFDVSRSDAARITCRPIT
jgi:hypothetical protein